MTAPAFPYGCGEDPCVCDTEPVRTAEDILADLLALVAVYETRPYAHRHIPAYIVREYIVREYIEGVRTK